MKLFVTWRVWASAILLGAGSAASAAPEDTLKEIQAQIDALKKQGTVKANEGSLAIESWLLSATAIERTAEAIGTAVTAVKPKKQILVIAGDEAPDFSLPVMMTMEIHSLTARLQSACGCGGGEAGSGPVHTLNGVGAVATIGTIIGLLKSDTELTAIEQEVDAGLLAAAVARTLNATMPAVAVRAGQAPQGALITAFDKLVNVADEAQVVLDRLPADKDLTQAQARQKARLTALLTRYEAFYARVTTANTAGAVPLVTAARLQNLTEQDPYILRVNTEKAGGTLLKRTNVLTALGAESTFISAGLVSSYRMTDPAKGEIVANGVITCRTTLTTLKRVQDASWKNPTTRKAEANCLP